MPLQLLIQSAASGGVGILDATPFVTACTISHNEHGPQELSATVTRSLYDAFRVYDAPGTLDVSLNDGAVILWRGRLEDPGIAAGGTNALELHAYGYWRALSDQPYTALWSDTSVATWTIPQAADAGMASALPERYLIDTNNRLFIAPKHNATYQGTGSQGRLRYAVPSQIVATRQITGVQFAWTFLAPAGWTVDLYRYTSAGVFQATVWTVASSGAAINGADHLVITGCDMLVFAVYPNANPTTFAGEDGTAYLNVTRMRVVTSTTNRVNTTFTANRAAGAGVTATVGSTTGMYAGMQLAINTGAVPGEVITVTSITNATQFVATFGNAYVIGNPVQGHQVYTDEIVKELITFTNAANSSQLLSSTTGVASPAKDIADAIYDDAVPQDVATDLAMMGDAVGRTWEVGVDVFQRLWFRVQASRARTWYVDIADISISRSLDGLRNSAFAVYEDANGATIRSAPASNTVSIRRYGINRSQAVDVATTSAILAGLTRDVSLAASAQLQPRASFTVRSVYATSGAYFPLAYVQAGDILTIRNLPPGASATIDTIRTFRITRVDYDALANTLTIEPEAPNPTLDALIAGQV